MKLKTRVAYRPQENKIWLEIVHVATDTKAISEQLLLNRTPKLQRYYNLNRNNSVAKVVHRKYKAKIVNRTQTLFSRYIDIVPVGLRNEWQRQMKERLIQSIILEGDDEKDS